MNTADYLLETADDRKTALIVNSDQYSYGDLRAACARMAGELTVLRVQPGERVGILGENSLFWVAAYIAILKLGAIAVPFPVVCTSDDLRRRENVVRCRAMCVEARLLRKFSGALTEGVSIVSSDVLSEPGPLHWEFPQPNFDRRQDAALMLTSGTTALPRAVRITHRNIQANTDSIIECLELDSSERTLVILPFYYCFGTSLLHTHLRVGGSMAVCNTFAYPETALTMIEQTRSTGIAGVPSSFQTLLRATSFPTRKFPSLRKVQQAGGKLPPVFLRELMSILPDARIYTMYGQTEATARLSCLSPDLLPAKLGSIGRGIPGVTLKVVGSDGRPVQRGEVGELLAKGDNISPGYFEDAEASAEKFDQGWLRSGDLATVDEDGFIFIVDRKSDFIKSLGHRVSSQEVEAKVLDAFPDIVAAAAIGQPDPVYGESITVFVIVREGAVVCPEEILRRCRATMARHMVPKTVIVRESLPTNAHGKVVKSLLRQDVIPVASHAQAGSQLSGSQL